MRTIHCVFCKDGAMNTDVFRGSKYYRECDICGKRIEVEVQKPVNK